MWIRICTWHLLLQILLLSRIRIVIYGVLIDNTLSGMATPHSNLHYSCFVNESLYGKNAIIESVRGVPVVLSTTNILQACEVLAGYGFPYSDYFLQMLV